MISNFPPVRPPSRSLWRYPHRRHAFRIKSAHGRADRDGYKTSYEDVILRNCRFAGGAFINARQGLIVDLVFRVDRLDIFAAYGTGIRPPQDTIPYGNSFILNLTGPGRVTTGGGFSGGGFGLAAAAEGMAIAAFINAVATKTTTVSVVQVGDDHHEAFFVNTDATPEQLRRYLSPTFVRLRQARHRLSVSTARVVPLPSSPMTWSASLNGSRFSMPPARLQTKSLLMPSLADDGPLNEPRTGWAVQPGRVRRSAQRISSMFMWRWPSGIAGLGRPRFSSSSAQYMLQSAAAFFGA